MPQHMPEAPQMPVAGQQQPMATQVPRMPRTMPPRMAEVGPQMVAEPRPALGVVRPQGAGGDSPAQAAAPGSNNSMNQRALDTAHYLRHRD